MYTLLASKEEKGGISRLAVWLRVSHLVGLPRHAFALQQRKYPDTFSM